MVEKHKFGRDGLIEDGVSSHLTLQGDAQAPEALTADEDDLFQYRQEDKSRSAISGRAYDRRLSTCDIEAEDSLKSVAERRKTRTAEHATKFRQPDKEIERANDQAAMARLEPLGEKPPYDKNDEHELLFIAPSDGPVEPLRASSYMRDFQLALDRVADEHPEVRAGYVNAPSIEMMEASKVSRVYLANSKQASRRMFERLVTQEWEWRQSDPKARITIDTLDQSAECVVEAQTSLAAIARLGIPDRTELHVTKYGAGEIRR